MPDPDDAFTEYVREALEGLPADIASRVDNVEIAIADEEPGEPGRLGYYQGIPLTRRTRGYSFVLPDRIMIYRRPLERLFGHDSEQLRREVHHVVLHELAHHFGISDARLRELGRY